MVYFAACGWMPARAAAAAAAILRLGDSAGGVSADGSVVAGSFFDPMSEQLRAYRWESGVMANLGVTPGSAGSFGAEISADGRVVVGQSGQFAFRWTAGGGIVSLGDLPGGANNSVAWNANGDGGIVVGGASQTSGFRGFRWTAPTAMTALGDLPGGFDFSVANSVSADGSVIVGSSTGSSGDRAVRWLDSNATPESLGVLRPNHDFSEALDVNVDGQVIVGVSGNGLENEAFRWTPSNGFEGLGDLPGGLLDSVAGGVSADGSVIIGTGNPGDDLPDEPFYWTEADGLRRLWDVAIDAGIDMTAWQSLTIATDLSADGSVIVGSGVTTAGEFAGFRMVVPDPAGLAPVSMLAVLLRRRSRERLSAPVANGRPRHGGLLWPARA